MFTEYRDVKQEAHGRRRWFDADGLELIVWHDDHRALEGFQLCYRHAQQQWALTWRPDVGFAHDLVHSGDTRLFHKQVPFLEPRGLAAWDEVTARFINHAVSLDASLRDFILARLAEGRSQGAGGSTGSRSTAAG